MEFAGYLAEFGGALIGGIALLFLVVVTLRSRKIPECYSCGAMKVRPSRAEGFWDTFATAFLIRPYRCGGCRERYYGFRNAYEDWKKAQAQRPRVVKVAFRFRYGLPNRIAIRVTDPSKKPDEILNNPSELELGPSISA
jgi:hypothetical protein